MSDEESFQYVKRMLPLFRAVVKSDVYGACSFGYSILGHCVGSLIHDLQASGTSTLFRSIAFILCK